MELLLKEYGYVAIVLVLHCFINFLMAAQVWSARKKYKYAPETENENANFFNCVQRGHRHSLEMMPMLMIFGGIRHPLICVSLGVVYGIARFFYFKGYSTGDLRKQFTMGMMLQIQILFYLLISSRTEAVYVDKTYLQNAVAKGAVCLDGSPPVYHFDRGFETGINSWLVHIEGGGWCHDVPTCLDRKSTKQGSSKDMAKQLAFNGILSNKPQFNPDFYNWNRIKVRYCDGSSFTGDVEVVDPETKLYFRGARIFLAVMEELLEKGMKKAENAILSGSSAGGLTSILHCDNFRSLVPEETKVKCISDAGYFINVKDISGASYMEDYYNDVVMTHGAAKNLPSSCTSKGKPGLCFFPQNIAQQIRTPLFITNAAYDSWQITHSLVPNVSDPNGTWLNCKKNISNCTPSQLQTIQGFRLEFINALTGIGVPISRGYYINSCYTHSQTEGETWFETHSPILNNKTIAKVVGDWFYD